MAAIPSFPRPLKASLTHRSTRRSVLRAGAGLAAAAALGIPNRRAVEAQGLTGKVTVGYDASNAAIGQLVEGAVAALQAAAPDAQIEISKAPAGNFQTQLFLSLGAGRAPDVFITTGLGVGELGAGGYLAPLDPYLDRWEAWPQYPAAVRAAIAPGGSTWGLPTALDAHFLYYRKDLFEEAGLPREWAPGTPDEVLAAARQLKERLPDVMPYALYAGASAGNATAIRAFAPLAFAYGGTLTDDRGRWIIDSCPILEALSYYETVYRVDKTVPEEVMTTSNPSRMVREAIATGDLAMVYDGSWIYDDWASAVPDVAREEIGYILYPMADGRRKLNLGGLGNCWYMNAKAQNTDLAWALIAAGNTKEALVALNAADPHLPPREDAAADEAFRQDPFLATMIASFPSLTLFPADPGYRQLVGVIQNATGIVATGEATPEEAVERYASEMTRILGEDRVVAQPCE